MALFKTIDELALFVPIMKSFDFNLVSPDIERAEGRWIIPMLSQAMYDELFAAYDANTLSDDQEELLAKVRKPLAQLAFFLYAPKGNVNVSSSGIQQTHSDNAKPAFQWSVDQMMQSYLDGGYEDLDNLQAYLDAHKDDFETWATSTAYTESKELFLNTPKEFSTHFNINTSRRTFLAMRHILKRHNDDTIKALLGDDLYDEIKEQVIDEDISVNNNELLANYIRPALVHLTMADALTELSIQINEFGITVISSFNAVNMPTSQSRNPASSSIISDLYKKEKKLAEQTLDKLREYLEANADDYPLYTVVDTSATPTAFENDSTSGIAFI